MRFREMVQRNPTLWLTWSLVLLAHLATEIVVGAESRDVWGISLKGILLAITSGGALAWTRGRHVAITGLTMMLSLLAMAAPLLIEPFWRWGTGTGHPLEVQLLIGFRNLAVVLLFWACHPRVERLAVLSSLFALLFCVSTTPDLSLVAVSGVYLLIGVCWLSTVYWSALKTEYVVGQQARAPWLLLSCLSIVLLLSVSLLALPTESRTRMLQGFLPSSGGTGRADDFARAGVGDGNALVPGTERAMSFAPIEEAPFIEGQEPSLYDVFQDTYGEPKPPKKSDRAIALPPELFTPNHHRMAEAKKAGKTFTLERRRRENPGHRHLQDTPSRAVLHLVGRVPVHLRHTTYDLFDGYEWYPEALSPDRARQLSVVDLKGTPWIRWPMRSLEHDIFHTEPHALRVLNIKTNRVLSPVNLLGVHIDLCDRADLFRWEQQDILAMDRKTLPGMTVIHLQSHLLDEHRLSHETHTFFSGAPELLALPRGSEMESLREIADEWTADCRTKWEKVVAIRERLRAEYIHDPDVIVPDDCENPVAWFLRDGKRGTDYLFASAAVLLCRSQGIACRAVSGFYASPENYDPLARQTAVEPEDIHWWAEVSLGGSNWATLETTPGYETLQPRRSLLASAWIYIKRGGWLLLVYWPISLAVGLLGLITVQQRDRIESQLLTWRWRLLHDRPGVREHVGPLVLNSLKVLERKLQLAGTPRPACMSFGRYLRSGLLEPERVGVTPTDLHTLSRLSDWATYSCSSRPVVDVEVGEVRRVCRKLILSTRVNRSVPRQTAVSLNSINETRS